MKRILVTVTLISTLFSCKNFSDGEYIVTGEVKGMKNGIAYLEKQSPMGMGGLPVDTVKIVDGKFEIKGKITEPEIHFIQIEKVQGKVPFILEEGEIEINVDKDSIFKSKLSGTYNNEEFSKFGEESTKIQKRLQKKVMDFQNQNMTKMMEARKNQDTTTMNDLRKQYELIQKDLTDYTLGYPKSHPKSYISILITQGMFNNPNMKVEEIESIYNSLDESVKNTKPGKEVKSNIASLKNFEKSKKSIAVGKIAPDFKAQTPDGKTTSLKQNLGKVTLVDFWASWCQPCRKENPNVVVLYNKFHNQGLNIIGVSLDKESTKWTEAIAKDKLTWTHVSNLKGFEDPIAKQYAISQIPSTFLLDASGKIIAMDLHGEELKAKIKELLTK